MSRVPAALLLSAIALAMHVGDGAGQTLPLQRDVPEIRWGGCPAPVQALPVDSARAAQAERLGAEATQASILGDNDAAYALLEQAVALDPGSATLTYRLARTAEESGRNERGVELYCRYLALAPGSQDSPEVRQRLEALTTPAGFAVPAAGADAFRKGLEAYDAQRYAEADQAFGEAVAAAPDWGAARYNRGVARLAQGLLDPAAADFRRYLQQTPDAPEFDRIIDLLGSARVPAARATRSGFGTFATGLLLPGLGHLTTGRTGRGLLVMGTAAAALATGFLVEEVEVRCLGVPVDGVCPDDQVLGEESSRPLLVPGVAAALAVGLIGAIDAWRGVVRDNQRAAAADGREARLQGIRFAAPDVRVSLAGAHLELLRIRF